MSRRIVRAADLAGEVCRDGGGLYLRRAVARGAAAIRQPTLLGSVDTDGRMGVLQVDRAIRLAVERGHLERDESSPSGYRVTQRGEREVPGARLGHVPAWTGRTEVPRG